MTDESLPPPTGTTPLPPPSLSPEQQELCKTLDEWHEQYESLKVKPSKTFEGAIFAIRPECGSNPDRIAQAAHSLREIIYPFWSPQVKSVSDKKGNALKKYGSVFVDEEAVGRAYNQLNDLAHHRSASTNFEQVIANFVRVMRHVLTRQVDVHKEIDQILSSDLTQLALDTPTASQ